jgi:tRNA(Ile)-lysidine synthase
MPDVIAKVARTVRRNALLGPKDRVAVAVSGGSDSVALAWILRTVAPEFGASLAGLIHVNHGLRGVESDADEAFCRALAERLGVPLEVRRRDVAGLARDRHVSLEVAAREARYSCFDEGADSLGANLVATGHTEDDQAETVLLRLLRGAGNRGLSGIRIRRGSFVRPLLETRRTELQHYLHALGEAWREDASNADRAIIRNRIRHELVPVLQDIAPGGVRALARFARLAADDEAFLEGAANENRARLVLSDRSIDAAVLGALPAVLARRLVRRFASEAAPEANLSADHLEAVCRLAATDNPVGSLDLPGLNVHKGAGRLEFSPGPRRTPGSGGSWPVRELDVPGFVVLPEAGVAIEARAMDASEALDASRAHEAERAVRVVIQRGPDASRLLVRNRRPGDRFHPLGAPGRRKLQDVFVDRKVPRLERDTVPIVTDSHGEIVWVAGVALAERCRIRLPGNDMLLLELRKHR